MRQKNRNIHIIDNIEAVAATKEKKGPRGERHHKNHKSVGNRKGTLQSSNTPKGVSLTEGGTHTRHHQQGTSAEKIRKKKGGFQKKQINGTKEQIRHAAAAGG